MAYFNKISLLYLNDDQSKFLVCEKDDFTSDFIMPGGQVDDGENDEECLIREIKGGLGVHTDKTGLVFINEYVDVTAGDPTKDVSIKLYGGKITGKPKPSAEITRFHLVGRSEVSHSRLSLITKW